MPQDKELEIRLQFLEEATEYLNTIESAMLQLATAHINDNQMDAVLRAAHSIKGGAAMMGFQTLSHLAHRFEDFQSIKNTETFYRAWDRKFTSWGWSLRQVITQNLQGTVVDERWLETDVNPVFEKLYERLGAPQAEDMITSLLPEDQQGMVTLILKPK